MPEETLYTWTEDGITRLIEFNDKLGVDRYCCRGCEPCCFCWRIEIVHGLDEGCNEAGVDITKPGFEGNVELNENECTCAGQGIVVYLCRNGGEQIEAEVVFEFFKVSYDRAVLQVRYNSTPYGGALDVLCRPEESSITYGECHSSISFSIPVPGAGTLSVDFDNCTDIPCDCSECPEDCSGEAYQHAYCVDLTDGVTTEEYTLWHQAGFPCMWATDDEAVTLFCASGLWQMEGPDAMLYVAIAAPDNPIPPTGVGAWTEVQTGDWELSAIEECFDSSSSTSSSSSL